MCMAFLKQTQFIKDSLCSAPVQILGSQGLGIKYSHNEFIKSVQIMIHKV